MKLEAFASRIFSPTPFPHFVVQTPLGAATSAALLRWFETDAPWRLKIASFYQQYEFSLLDIELPHVIQALCSTECVNRIRQHVSEAFEVSLASRHDITAQKLVPGQRIRIHTDFIPCQESHRLLIQFNRGWANDRGGILLFFGSGDTNDISKAFLPLHDSGVAFEISPQSHHAVTPVARGERYTLVYSFYRVNAKYA